MCPAITLHKWKKDWHWIQKYHNFYISNCLYWLLFRNTLISQESLSAERISIFNLLFYVWFFLPPFLITTSSSNCPTHSASLQKWPALGGSAFFRRTFWFFFCFFHITKLQFYSHMFKFRFLFLNPLKSNSTSSYLLYPSSLKASKLLFSPSILSALLWLEVQVWGDYKRRINIHLAFLILSASTLLSLTLLYTFCLKKTDNHKST